MDSVTQAALGATIAGAIAGKQCNAKILLLGAALGTLPDLDVLIDYGDAVSNTVKHRGFSHSLLLIPLFALLMSWLFCQWVSDKFWGFKRVFALIFCILFTHPLLDALTTYGTQLIWPFSGYFELRTIFIIDPLYTLPLLIAIIIFLVSKQKKSSVFVIALIVSSLYLTWGYVAQQYALHYAKQSLKEKNISYENILVMPTPLNTLLWRILVLDEKNTRYYEGLASLLDKDKKINFIERPLGNWPLTEKTKTLRNLTSFSHSFLSYRIENNKLIVTDIRLGLANNLTFEFIFAEKNPNNEWILLDKPKRYPSKPNYQLLNNLWLRVMGDQDINANLEKTNKE